MERGPDCRGLGHEPVRSVQDREDLRVRVAFAGHQRPASSGNCSVGGKLSTAGIRYFCSPHDQDSALYPLNASAYRCRERPRR